MPLFEGGRDNGLINIILHFDMNKKHCIHLNFEIFSELKRNEPREGSEGRQCEDQDDEDCQVDREAGDAGGADRWLELRRGVS